MGQPIFLTIFFGLFLAIGLLILGFGARSLYMSKLAESWPTVQGRIISSDFETSTDSDGDTTYRANISYEYDVMGRRLTSDRVAFGYSGSSSYGFHKEIHDALPAGATVAVRYDPSKPERAALSYGLNQSILFLLIFGAVWTFFTVGMIAMFWISEQGAGGLLQNMNVYDRPQ